MCTELRVSIYNNVQFISVIYSEIIEDFYRNLSSIFYFRV